MTTILEATPPKILLQDPSWYVLTPQSIGPNGLKGPLVEDSDHKVELVINGMESLEGRRWHWVQDPRREAGLILSLHASDSGMDLCFTE